MLPHTINIYSGGSYNEIHDCENVYLSCEKAEVKVDKEPIIIDDAHETQGLADPLCTDKAKGTPSRGRSAEPLFAEGEHEQAMLFAEFLRDHRRFVEVNTSKDNYVNKAFVAFYEQWQKARLVPAQPNGNSCYRFLKDCCGLTMKPEMNTYANFIRQYITEGYCSTLDDVALEVERFMLNRRNI